MYNVDIKTKTINNILKSVCSIRAGSVATNK